MIGFYLAFMSGMILATIFSFWHSSQGNELHETMLFGSVILLAQLLAGVSASLFGSLSPIMFKMCRVDPGNIAGPLETAFQDLVGVNGIIMLGMLILGKSHAI